MQDGKFWLCHGLTHKGKPCGYMVPRGTAMCDCCGHMPPAHVFCPTSGKGGGKGGGSPGGKGSKPAKGGGKGKAGKPDDKLQKALEAKAQAEAQSKAAAKTQSALEAEIKQLKEAAAAGPKPGPEQAMELDHGGTEAHLLALDTAIEAAKLEQKELLASTNFQKSFMADFEAAVAGAQAKVDGAILARREANPLKKQLEGAEGAQQRSAKRLAAAGEQLLALGKAAEEATAAVATQQGVLAAAEEAHARAHGQLESAH